jgi:hypothetical protein
MYRFVALILVLPFLTACPDDSVVPVISEIAPGILADARIDVSTGRMPSGEVKVRGEVVIENNSSQSFLYSNSRLWLKVGQEISRRAYVESVASHAVDSGFVEIPAGQNLKLSVYWVFSKRIHISFDDRTVSIGFAAP